MLTAASSLFRVIHGCSADMHSDTAAVYADNSTCMDCADMGQLLGLQPAALDPQVREPAVPLRPMPRRAPLGNRHDDEVSGREGER
eukprot:3908358-Rhodomonas_salina.1